MARAKAIRIDFVNNPWDRKVKRMYGRFTAATIAKSTTLTIHQVHARIAKLRPERDTLRYRRGETVSAKFAIANIDRLLGDAAEMRRRIKEILKRRNVA